ncbi:tlde1 domain-containing protein [Teredinibacter turnerae]|uniref:tlde1 domain-containing protein n=1 Tax=Teredinibacter turnerae TaxID=2426 RepID=UPI000380F628|nr:tlde1 domain-containing protein [Teredinibacter turnerae]
MKIDLFYDGRFLKWNDKSLTFKATSGMSGHQMPGEQCIPDAGPVPEGEYKVFISDHGVAKDDGRGICAIKPSWGIQVIPRGRDAGVCEPYWANWGRNRARMEPANEQTKRACSPNIRGGFYLHDSTKGYSHGCIEVETKIFEYLRKYHSVSKKQYIILQVRYVAGRSTNGGTKV